MSKLAEDLVRHERLTRKLGDRIGKLSSAERLALSIELLEAGLPAYAEMVTRTVSNRLSMGLP